MNTYAITATLGSNPNYDIDVTDGVFTISQKAATIVIDNLGKIYGAADPTLTAVVSGTVGSDTLNYTLQRAAGENVNAYAITATLGSNPNYAISVTDGVLTIGQKAATIVIDNLGKTYGAADPTLTAVVSGTVGSDTLNYTLQRAAGENVNTYAITATLGANANYAITVTDGVFTITKQAATIVVDNKGKTYGDADPVFTAVVTGNVNNETIEYTFARAAGENVGSYAIQAVLPVESTVNANYDITVTNGTLAIDPRAASITIDNKTKRSGNADPAFTAIVSGTVNGDALVYSLNREAGAAVGTYTITASIDFTNAVNKNYDITVYDGTLTILRVITSTPTPTATVTPTPTATPTATPSAVIIPEPSVPASGSPSSSSMFIPIVLGGAALLTLLLLIFILAKRRKNEQEE